MASLFDVFGRLLLDDDTFQADAIKAGEKAGQSVSSRLAGGLARNKQVLTAFGTGMGIALAGATEAAITFEDQLRTIQTVVPDINIDKLGSDIKNLAAETGKSTDDLTSGFYDLVSAGVDADEAINVLRDSAKFATGALGSTAESVDLVTSVMNAYGLQASDSARITDVFAKAVADGKVTASELGASIANIAPIASSAGISIEEVSAGFAQLTAKGVPAAQAATQMRAAISALLTPNTQLNEIQEQTGINFAELAKTQGLAVALEALRKATNGNADAFAKSLGSVEAYQFALASTGDNAAAFADQIVETADSAGLATDQYNIKSQSMAEQAKRTAATLNNLVLDVGGAIAPFGQLFFAVNQMGPAFRGLISPAKILGGVLGGLAGRAVAGLAGVFEDISLGRRTGVAGAVSKAGAAMGRIFALAMSGASFIASKLGAAFDLLPGSGAIRAAVSKAGAKIGAVFAASMFGAQALATSLGSALSALPGAGAVKGAMSKVGGALGGGLGAFAAAAFAAVMIFEVVETYNRIKKELDEQLSKISADANAQLVSGTDEALATQKAALERGIADLNATWDFGIFTNDAREKLQSELDATNAEIDRRASQMGPIVGDNLAAGADAVAGGAETGIYDPITGTMVAATKAAADEAKATPREIADSLRDGRFRVKDATDALKQAFKDSISPTKEIARIEAFLAGKALNKALRSNRPEVRAEAEAWKVAAEDRLFALKNNVPEIALDTGQDYADALEKQKTSVRDAAIALTRAVQGTLGSLHLKDEGRHAGQEFASGLESQIDNIARMAARIAAAVAANLKFGSPTKEGPFSEAGGPEGWGRKGAGDWLHGWSDTLRRGAASFQGALAQYASPAAPLGGLGPMPALAGAGIAGSLARTVGMASSVGGITINGGVHVDARGARDPEAVRISTQQGIEDAMADGFRRQTARLPIGGRS